MSEWQRQRLGDLIDIKHGYAFKGEYFSDDGNGPLLLTPGNFMLGGGFKSGKPKYYLGPVPDAFELATGDLVVTMTDLSKSGDTLGYPAIIPPGPSYLHNQRIGLVIVRAPDKIDRQYLYSVLRTDSYRKHILASATGSTVRHTSPSRIYDFEFKAPSLCEQQAIAAVLVALDDKIAINERMALTCHGLAESLFQWATKASESVPLSSVVDPILGGTPDRTIAEYWGPGYLWASAKDVVASKFGILIATEEQVTELAVTQTKVKPVTKGSVILTARGTVGAVARVAQPTALNQSCYAFVPSPIPSGVLYLMVRAATQQMLGMAHGTVFSTVNMKSFDHIHAPVLGKAGLEALQGEVSPLFDMIETRVQENRSLSNLRDTLLPKLMSGEIRVREAERIVEDVT